MKFKPKYIFCILLCLFLAVGLIIGKSGGDVRVSLTMDASGVGAVNFVDLKSKGLKADYDFSYSPTAKSAVDKLISGECEIAVTSADRAAALTSSDKKYVCLAYLSKGDYGLFFEGGGISSVEDLAGKTIYMKEDFPAGEYILKTVLEYSGINPQISTRIRFKSSNKALREALLSNDRSVIFTGSPFSASIITSTSASKVIDVAKLFAEAEPDVPLVSSVVITTKDFAEQNATVINEFLEQLEASFKESVENTESASELAIKYGITSKSSIAATMLYSVDLKVVSGGEMAEDMTAYYRFLNSKNVMLIGNVPEKEFYYINE